MRIDVPLSDGIGLRMASGKGVTNSYPTARIAKGWLLFCDGHNLSEEAVGFGVPILKRGLQTIFPGSVELSADETGQANHFVARYTLNLEERLSHAGGTSGANMIDNRLVYGAKNTLAGMIRGFPALRRTLTDASSFLRNKFGWQTTYVDSGFSTEIRLTYTILPAENKLLVELSEPGFSSPRTSEFIVMNEQGAHHFDEYQDGSGTRRGDQIGCWDEVIGSIASFISKSSHISFSLPRVDGAHLYHGRELIGSRLAWSGFGYTLTPGRKSFRYEITLRRLL
jgi:hypothetical protein